MDPRGGNRRSRFLRCLARRGSASPQRGRRSMPGVLRDGQFPGRGRQKTLSFGPEAGKATLKAQLAEEIAQVRKVRPELVAVADAAPDNWTFLEKLRPNERAVDFFHAQRGFRPSRATGSTAPSCATTSAARSAIRYLRDKATTEPEVLRRELGFFRKRRHRLRKPQGQRLHAPASSANKVLVNQRMKRARWSMRSECPHHRWSDHLAWRLEPRTKRRMPLDGENQAVKTGVWQK